MQSIDNFIPPELKYKNPTARLHMLLRLNCRTGNRWEFIKRYDTK